MIPDCDRRSDGQTVRQTESIIAKTALCIASYADALSKIDTVIAKVYQNVRKSLKSDVIISIIYC